MLPLGEPYAHPRQSQLPARHPARQTKPAANATTQRGPNPKALANYHLFGKADAPVKAVKAPVEKKIKQTNLKLTLKGTMARSDPKGGIAMISAERGKEKAYLVGESVAEVADLYEVYFDRVILKRGDALEELLLTRVKASNGRNSRSGTTNRRTNTRNATVSKATGRTTPAVTAGGKPDYRKIREELINNPEKVTDYIRVQPVQKDGKISGYRIYPGRNRDLFRKAGLRSGDLITAVNGQTLEDPNQGIAILAALTTAERIDLNIKRRGRDRQIVVDLNE